MMNRTLHYVLARGGVVVAVVTGLLALSACGGTGTPLSKVKAPSSTSTTVVDSLTTASSVTTVTTLAGASAAPTTALASAVAASVTTVPAPAKVAPAPVATPPVAAPVVVDPALTRALNDAKVLLGSNTQDLNDAAAAAANGG